MREQAIKVEGLGKKYTIGVKKDGSLRGTIANLFKSKVAKGEDFWALKNMNFEVESGDIIGIIGKNGAGKSTLLKVLSKITRPTEGRIEINGRVASLLEVGTGFHPELTGRENIFLNGTILGMTRKEVVSKFEEIVDFSGVRKFIDTPVKRYSSGQYVRLAFSVAAHLEPEILIIDEVLAVGDAEFQKKCLGKMKDVAGQGRTVIFVSHNMAAVKSLCTKGIVLEHGQCAFQGNINDATAYYLENNSSTEQLIHTGDLSSAPGNDSIRLLRVEAKPAEGSAITMSSEIHFNIEFYSFLDNINLDLTLELRTSDEIAVFHKGYIISENNELNPGYFSVSVKLPAKLLNAGKYTISLIFGENQRYLIYRSDEIVTFEVELETSGSNSERLPGVIAPELAYTISYSATK